MIEKGQSPSRVDQLSTFTFELRDGQSFEMPLTGRWNLKVLTYYSTWLPPWVHKYHPDPCQLEIVSPDWISLEGGRPRIEVISFCRTELQVWLKDMGPVLVLGKAKIINRSYWEQITESPKEENLCSGSQILGQYLW